MQRFLAVAALAGVVLLAAKPAAAVTTFYANITHDQEVANPGIPNEGSSGYGLFELNDAQTALSYDVRLTGLDLIRALRSDARTAGMRILILTADASPDGKTSVLATGADDYLVKPVDPALLARRVRALLA